MNETLPISNTINMDDKTALSFLDFREEDADVNVAELKTKMTRTAAANVSYAVNQAQVPLLDCCLKAFFELKTLAFVFDEPCAISVDLLKNHIVHAGGGEKTSINTNSLINVLKKIAWAIADLLDASTDTQPLKPGSSKMGTVARAQISVNSVSFTEKSETTILPE